MTIGIGASGIPTTLLSADDAARIDPIRNTADDGWSPDKTTPTKSNFNGGFLGASLQFALGDHPEKRGQRLSKAQVNTLAPIFSKRYGISESEVRNLLTKTYLYVGGPSTNQNAMTIGTHVYVPDDESLKTITSPRGRNWLTHELAHTMQFASIGGGSEHRFLANYLKGLVVGRKTALANNEDPAIWGSIFTALTAKGKTADKIGAPVTKAKDRLLLGTAPTAVLAAPVALFSGGALSLAKRTSPHSILSTARPMSLALGSIAAPALTGGLIGASPLPLTSTSATTLGALAGGTTALGAALATGLTRGAASKQAKLALNFAATLTGGTIGSLFARVSKETASGWRELPSDNASQSSRTLSYSDALHDTHWMELDADDAMRNAYTPTSIQPVNTASHKSKISEKLNDRIDWGLRIPLILGLPAAGIVGGGVLSGRTGVEIIKQASSGAKFIGQSKTSAALYKLGSKRLGVGNSLSIGASVTAAPMIASGLLAPIATDITKSEKAGRVSGGIIGAITGGGLATLSMSGRGSAATRTAWGIFGAITAGVTGALSGSAAIGARTPHGYTYLP